MFLKGTTCATVFDDDSDQGMWFCQISLDLCNYNPAQAKNIILSHEPTFAVSEVNR